MAQKRKPKRKTTRGKASTKAPVTPSPAWERMRAKKPTAVQADFGPEFRKRERPRPKPRPNIDYDMHPVESEDQQRRHLSRNCPYCIVPGYISGGGWPVPCMVKITEDGMVRCSDTASAEHIGHHHDCTFWDHTDGVPF